MQLAFQILIAFSRDRDQISTAMPDSSEVLIETAVRPLEDPAELHLAAAAYLQPLITGDHQMTAAVIRRWDALDAQKRRPLWGIALWVLVALNRSHASAPEEFLQR